MKDVTQELAEKQINPNAMSIGAQYIHIVNGIDVLVFSKFAGKTPLADGEWRDKKGFSPAMTDGTDQLEWAKQVKFELDQLKKYCDTVHQAVDEYLAGLDDQTITEEVDFSDWGMGTQPKSFLLTMTLLNTMAHVGEIANMKGLEGLQGYPW